MLESQTDRGGHGLVARVRAVVSDAWSRTFATTTLATAWDLLYAIYLNVAGHMEDSLRMRMTSAYYFSLVGVGACALVGFALAARASRAHDERGRAKAELVAALVGGIFLLSVNAVVALVVKRAGEGWQVAAYSDASYYMLTAYALVMLALTAFGWHRYRRDSSPVVSLAKGLSLCKATMTLFFLAVAAVQRYAGGDEHFLHLMLSGAASSAGMVAAALSFVISVVTLVRSTRGLWAQRSGEAGEGGTRG